MARVATPGVTTAARPQHRHHFILNTDGKRHPLENSASIVSLALGVLAAVCAFMPSMHVLGVWSGGAGLAVGGWSQMISATTAERLVNVIAVTLSGIGLLFGLAHGGLY
jgi:hypothetical protein